MRNSVFLFCMYCMLFFLACKNGSSGKYSIARKSLSSKETLLTARFYFSIINESTTTIEVNEEKVITGNESKTGMYYEFSKDTGDNRILKMTYDKIHIILKDKNGEKEIDAANAINSIDQSERLLGFIKGSAIVVHLDKNGEILSIDGNNEISDKIMAELNITDETSRKKVKEQIDKLIGKEFIRKNISQGMNFIPDTSMEIGESWTKNTEESSYLKFRIETKYTLKALSDSIATVESTAEIGNSDIPNSIMGNQVSAELNGNQTGEYKVNYITGMLASGKTKIDLEGVLQSMGRETPINIKISNEISGVRIK